MENTTLTISLPADLRSYVENRVADGQNGSIDTYIQALIVADQQRSPEGTLEAWLMQGLEAASPVIRRRERERRVAIMRELIQEGLDDLNAGRSVPAEEVFRELYERNRRMARTAGQDK